MARIVAVLVAFAILVPAARAQEVIAPIGAPTPLAAYGGWIAWSERDGRAGPFRLVLRAPDGSIGRVAVPPSGSAFDVDLGPDVDGGVVAAYTRCSSSDCSPYLYDVSEGRERRLDGIDAPRADESWPSPWRGRIAFQRRYDHKRAYPYLYTSRYDRRVRSVRMPGGAREECVRDRRTRRLSCSPDTRSRATGIELAGTRMAFAWTYSGRSEGLDTEIRLDTIGGGHERIAHQDGGGLTQPTLAWPAIDEGRLYWTRSCVGDLSGCVRRHEVLRRRIRGGPIDSMPGPVTVVSHDRDRRRNLIISERGGFDCQEDPPGPRPTCELRAWSYPGSP